MRHAPIALIPGAIFPGTLYVKSTKSTYLHPTIEAVPFNGNFKIEAQGLPTHICRGAEVELVAFLLKIRNWIFAGKLIA